MIFSSLRQLRVAHTPSPTQQRSGYQPCPEAALCQQPRATQPSDYLFETSLDAAVLAGDHLAVPVLRSPAGQAEVRVALPHGQVARALLGVALGFAAAAWEAILTCRNTAWVFQREGRAACPCPAETQKLLQGLALGSVQMQNSNCL